MRIKTLQCKINLTKDQQTRFMLDITTTKWWPSCSIIFSSWLFFSASNSPCCFHSIASSADSWALTLSQTAAARSHAPLLPLFCGSTLSLALRRVLQRQRSYTFQLLIGPPCWKKGRCWRSCAYLELHHNLCIRNWLPIFWLYCTPFIFHDSMYKKASLFKLERHDRLNYTYESK